MNPMIFRDPGIHAYLIGSIFLFHQDMLRQKASLVDSHLVLFGYIIMSYLIIYKLLKK